MSPPFNVQVVAAALITRSDEADLAAIYRATEEFLPNWRELYKNEESFHATIRATIHRHCPQSAEWQVGNEPFFERVATGRYRIVPPEDRPEVVRRGRVL